MTGREWSYARLREQAAAATAEPGGGEGGARAGVARFLFGCSSTGPTALPRDWFELRRDAKLRSFAAVLIGPPGAPLGALCVAMPARGAFEDREWWQLWLGAAGARTGAVPWGPRRMCMRTRTHTRAHPFSLSHARRPLPPPPRLQRRALSTACTTGKSPSCAACCGAWTRCQTPSSSSHACCRWGGAERGCAWGRGRPLLRLLLCLAQAPGSSSSWPRKARQRHAPAAPAAPQNARVYMLRAANLSMDVRLALVDELNTSKALIFSEAAAARGNGAQAHSRPPAPLTALVQAGGREGARGPAARSGLTPSSPPRSSLAQAAWRARVGARAGGVGRPSTAPSRRRWTSKTRCSGRRWP